MKNRTDSVFRDMLQVEDEEVEIYSYGDRHRINKLLLTAQSSIARMMLQAPMIERDNQRIVIENFAPWIVDLFVHYLRTMHCDLQEADEEYENFKWHHISELYQLAHMYEVDALMEECRVLLLGKINAQNAERVFVLGQIYDVYAWRKDAKKYICTCTGSAEK